MNCRIPHIHHVLALRDMIRWRGSVEKWLGRSKPESPNGMCANIGGGHLIQYRLHIIAKKKGSDANNLHAGTEVLANISLVWASPNYKDNDKQLCGKPVNPTINNNKPSVTVVTILNGGSLGDPRPSPCPGTSNNTRRRWQVRTTCPVLSNYSARPKRVACFNTQKRSLDILRSSMGMNRNEYQLLCWNVKE